MKHDMGGAAGMLGGFFSAGDVRWNGCVDILTCMNMCRYNVACSLYVDILICMNISAGMMLDVVYMWWTC